MMTLQKLKFVMQTIRLESKVKVEGKISSTSD